MGVKRGDGEAGPWRDPPLLILQLYIVKPRLDLEGLRRDYVKVGDKSIKPYNYMVNFL